MSALVELPPDLYSKTAFAGFNPGAGFDIGTARAMMWMSQLAYETGRPDTIAQIRPLWAFESISSFSAQAFALQASFDTRVIVGERPDARIVAFGGTDPLVWENMATNVDIGRNPRTNVHTGFETALEAVWSRIDNEISPKNRPLFFTGHSLGGALAALAAERAHAKQSAPAAIYVFGMPRVGGWEFAARYNEKLGPATYRLVHGHDLIASMPAIGFHHVGRMLWCGSGKKFDPAALLPGTDSNKPKFASGLINGFKALASGTLFSPPGPGPFGPLFKYLPLPLRDHLPDRYHAALAP